MKTLQNFTLFLLAITLFSAPLQAEEHPEATATSDPNVVTSPFEPYKNIDITGFLPGDLARDPHTNKVFRVPERMATPLVFKPEIIEEASEPAPTSLPDDTPIRRPEIVGEPDAVTDTDPGGSGIARPPAVAESDLPPLEEVPTVIEPVIPARSARVMDEKLTAFIRDFIRSGQQDDPAVQAQYLASTLSTFYGTADATREQVIAERTAFFAKWPRRIYVESPPPRFVRWITEKTDDEFVIDIRVYQSLKSVSEETKRGYADHRLAIREKSDGTFEITGTEERHPRSILAGQ